MYNISHASSHHCDDIWVILHILREASASLLVRLRWAHARASNRRTSNKYGSHAFFYNPVNVREKSHGKLSIMKIFQKHFYSSIHNRIHKHSGSRKIILISLLIAPSVSSQNVDFSVVSVPEESGIELVKVTKESDYVCLPPVKRNSKGISWLTNRIIAVSPDGKDIAYISLRENLTNIFIKDTEKQGPSRQRTNRTSIVDVTYSPDGTQICFTEANNHSNQMFITDSHKGYVCRQITTEYQDYSPIYSPDMKNIFFTRLENNNASIWSFNIEDKFLQSYTVGMNPYPAKNENAIYIARTGANGKGEIWKVDLELGEEECILSDPDRSFYSPMLSPTGDVLLLVGSSRISNDKFTYWNTDIYTCSIDGTNLSQLTSHAADDLSPIWSADGNYIYFISQRGNPQGTANIWRMKYSR